MKSSKKTNTANPFSKSGGFKVLGIGKQEAIKYFFGGNATLAIIVIMLIIGFLIYHSYNFFPQYRESLTLYRKSGQEFTDYASEQLKAQQKLSSLADQARGYEVEHRVGALYRITYIHSQFRSKILKEVKNENKEYKRSKFRLDEIKEDADATPESIKAAEADYKKYQNILKESVSAVANELTFGDVQNKTWKTDDKYLEPLRESLIESIIGDKETAFLKQIKEEEAAAIAKVDAAPEIKELATATASFKAPQKQFEKFVGKLRDIAANNKSQAVTYSTADDRKAALAIKEELTKSDELKERARIEQERILTVEPDYDTLNEPLYAALPQHREELSKLIEGTKEGFSQLPDASQFQAKGARKRLKEMDEIEKDIFDLMEEKRQQMEAWDHKEPVGMASTITGFFFGTRWVTNSSWQDIYGILPLLAGSVSVAFIAVVLAIPFAVGGAIYVNRLASPFEQKFIKPIIEFIGAIPSIVLAFFGVVVLGELIQTHSQNAFLSWLPGFPVEGRLTILNAGLLLAFMSIPTIFTLAEDALNNVPKSYKEASLALGATNIQTVLKVIIPSCASGIIAAVLLGFGRIIGETMVVLLVMGGRIAIPTSFTDPAHSMTGILAQEIGEVDEGSLHWGALFMVGLVLFIIALTLNYIAQTTLKKFGNK